MKTVEIVKLSQPILWHDTRLTELQVRAPNARDFFEIGEPWTYVQTAGGQAFRSDDMEKVGKYLDKCVTHEGGAALLGLVSLADAFALRDAVLDFFFDALTVTSPTGSESSSSG